MSTPDSKRSTPEYPEDEREFERSLERYDRVLVEFYADWCKPCERMDPIIDRAADSEDIPVIKVEVEDHPDIAAKHNVEAVPTVVLFEEEEPVERRVGRLDEAELERLLRTSTNRRLA